MAGTIVGPETEERALPEEGQPDSQDDLPIDPDVSVRTPAPHRRLWRTLTERSDLLLAIAVGGALGSLARWGVGEALAHDADEVAWSTVIVNVSGAFALGVLMVFVVDVWPPTRYVRPFLGVGVLGGYTTFSTYMLDTRSLISTGHLGLAGLYLLGTLLAGLVAVWLGILIARSAIRVLRWRHDHERASPSRDTESAEHPDSRSTR